MMALEGSTWKIWRAPGEDWNGPYGPGFNQRFIGEISADGKTIEGRWERGIGDVGDEWEVDFPINYVRIAAQLGWARLIRVRSGADDCHGRRDYRLVQATRGRC